MNLSFFSGDPSLPCISPSLRASAGGSVRVCSLPQGLHVGGPWPARHAALAPSAEPVAVAAVAAPPGASAAAAALHASCLAVAVRRTDLPFRPRAYGDADAATSASGGPPDTAADVFRDGYREAGDLARELAIRHRGLDPDAHEIRLVSSRTLECTWAQLLDPGEVVLSFAAVPVRNAQSGDVATMVAVGTAFPVPDDVPCRGRLLLFAAAAEGPPGSAAAQRFSAVLVAAKNLKGAVSAIAPIEGSHRG